MKLKLFILQIICLCAFVSAQAQTFTLSGRVIDENNDPVEFASVSCPKQGKMTMTSLKGDYSCYYWYNYYKDDYQKSW